MVGTATQPSSSIGSRCTVSLFAIGVSATQYSCQTPSGMTALQCSDAALMMPLFQACGTVSLPCECASSAIRSVSVIPPHRVTSG